jgi:anti-sigma B factor antagonist
MQIEFDIQNGLCILRLKGRFATGSDSAYQAAKKDLLKTGCRKVVADCAELSYLDSTGIGFFVGLYTTLKNSGGHFVLATVNRRVREVLDLTRLSQIMPIFADEKAAVAALNDPEFLETGGPSSRQVAATP